MTRFAKSSLLGAVIFAGMIAGCGASSSTPTTPIVADVVVNAISGLRFEQTQYTASAGEISFAYVNDDTIRHTLIVVLNDTKVATFELKVNKKGSVDTGSITLASGTYTLLCTVPGHQNMKASFTVK